jgi:sugar/nucleoside kinase (ribokinase family)
MEGRLLNKEKSFDVLAIGELNADLIFTGLKQGPVLNREIMAASYRKTLGSSTALCACNIAKLGLSVAFCGKTGKDETGAYVLEELKKRNINTNFCVCDPETDTGVTLALNWDGDRALVTVPGAMSGFSLNDFDINIIKQARHLHVGSFFLQFGLQKDLPEIFKTAHDWGLSTSLDSGWDDSENWDYGIRSVLKHTDIFFPNETEALNITGTSSFEDAVKSLENMCVNTALIKRGSRGAFCLSGGKRYAVDAMTDVKVVDTTGAGDAFNAGFIYAYLEGLSPEECLEYGNACGNICVGFPGGADSDLDLEKVTAMIRSHGRSRVLDP